MVCSWSWLPFCSLLLAACGAAAYDVPIADTDYDRQICSGMWAGKNTYINGEHILASLRVSSTLSLHSNIRRWVTGSASRGDI